VVASAATQEKGPQLNARAHTFAPRPGSVASDVSSTDAAAQVVAAWNANRMHCGAAAGLNGSSAASINTGQWTNGTGAWATQQQGYSLVQMPPPAYPPPLPAQYPMPPHGFTYTDIAGNAWMWNYYTGAYEYDLTQAAASYAAPSMSSTVSHHSGEAGSEDAGLAAATETWRASEASTQAPLCRPTVSIPTGSPKFGFRLFRTLVLWMCIILNTYSRPPQLPSGGDGPANESVQGEALEAAAVTQPTEVAAEALVVTQTAAEMEVESTETAAELVEPAVGYAAMAAAIPAADSHDRAYLKLSRVGNKATIPRSGLVSTIELELDAIGWESSEGLPALKQGPDIGPFTVILDHGAAKQMPSEIDLFDAKGDPHAFTVYKTDKRGNTIHDRPRPGARTTRAQTEDDEQRRTVLTFYDVPTELCGNTIAAGTLTDMVKTIERAQFVCVGTHAKRVNVHQPIVDGRPETKVTVYTTLKEGVTDETMKSLQWQGTRFLQWQKGEMPMQGTMAKACSLRLGRAPCCLRTSLACPGREVCNARDDAWRVAGYTPAVLTARPRVEKRDREEAKVTKAKTELKASKEAAIRQRIATLCTDFGMGKVTMPPAHAAIDTISMLPTLARAVPGGGLQRKARPPLLAGDDYVQVRLGQHVQMSVRERARVLLQRSQDQPGQLMPAGRRRRPGAIDVHRHARRAGREGIHSPRRRRPGSGHREGESQRALSEAGARAHIPVPRMLRDGRPTGGIASGEQRGQGDPHGRRVSRMPPAQRAGGIRGQTTGAPDGAQRWRAHVGAQPRVRKRANGRSTAAYRLVLPLQKSGSHPVHSGEGRWHSIPTRVDLHPHRPAWHTANWLALHARLTWVIAGPAGTND
jgi:hypothetical protein